MIGERHPGRRSEDPKDLFRHPWVRKFMAWASAALLGAATYFWNESRTALHDIEGLKSQVSEVKQEQRIIREKIDRAAQLSDQQRAELKTDVIRVENRVEKLDERFVDLQRQLSSWFQKASKQ